MALTVAFNGTNVTLADSVTDWDNDTITAAEAWTTEVVHQGAACIGFQASNKDGHGVYEMPTGSFDFTPTTGTHAGQHVFIWINVTMPGTVEALSTGGLYIVVGSGLTAYKKFLVAEKDAKEIMEKGFARYVLDPSKAATETVGTPDMSACTVFGAWIDTDESARIDQLFIDRIDVGWGLTVTGTSTDFWNDVYAEEISETAGERDNMWGVLQKYNDGFFLYGQMQIGDDSGSTTTTVSDSGKTIKFVSQQYYNASSQWVDMVADDFFKIEFVDNSGTATTQFTDGILVGSDNGRAGSTLGGSNLHDTAFDASALANASSYVKLYATKLSDFRAGITYHTDTDSLFYGGVITKSGQFDPKTAVMRNLTISETTDVDAAVLWNNSIDIESCQLIANTTGAGIEHTNIDNSPFNYTNLTFSGNTYDVLNVEAQTAVTAGSFVVGDGYKIVSVGTTDFTAIGAASNTVGVKFIATGVGSGTGTATECLVINKLSGSNPSSAENAGTNSDTIFSATYSHVLEGLELNTEVTYVTADTSTELFHVEEATTSDGNGKYKTTYSHSGGASVDILIHHVNYLPDISNIYGLTLPNANATVKVQMFEDVNYYNP